jgi:hypothetical protein
MQQHLQCTALNTLLLQAAVEAVVNGLVAAVLADIEVLLSVQQLVAVAVPNQCCQLLKELASP